MRRVQLLRHAKSDWNAGAGNDHARPLNGRGRRSADTMGRFLAAAGEIPDVVYSSTAVRARTTAERAIEAGAWDVELVLRDDLYLPHADAVLGVVGEAADRAERVMVVGHEPTWSTVVAQLTGATARMPTAACAGIDLLVPHWSAVAPGRGQLQYLLTPRLLGAAYGEG